MTKYQVNTKLSNGETINSGTILIPDATTIPIANSTTLGGVMPVNKTDGMTQEVGVDSTGKLYTAPGGGGGIKKTTIRLNLSDFTYDESSETFTLNETAITTVTEIINTAFNKKGINTAYMYIGDTPYASYNISFSNTALNNTPYISFSNADYTDATLAVTLNVLIIPTEGAQKICS